MPSNAARLAPHLHAGIAAMALGACAPAAPAPCPAPTTVAAPTCPEERQLAPCEASFGADASFAIDEAALVAKGGAGLVTKLRSSAYAYYRALAVEVALRTCAGFRDLRWQLPVVAVHGDAHIEQFVVTSTSYGLEDYDQSGFGPLVVDLVRYAASIHVACTEVSWPCHADEAVAAYFRAYRDALSHPVERKPPAIVERLRGDAPRDVRTWLAWADSLMQPLDAADEAKARRGFAELVRLLSEVRPDRPAAFYEIVRLGALQMGVGSALQPKVLFRIQGPTDAAADDLVVEARSMPPPSGRECAWRPAHGGAFQPLFFMSILGPRMPDIFGLVALDEDPGRPQFWAQSWEPGYRELAVADIQSDADLVALAEDAGRQIAGHVWTRFPEMLRAYQSHAQLRAFDMVEVRARDMARDFATEIVAEWRRFRGK
jgi:uncharacterized protein DUF2252